MALCRLRGRSVRASGIGAAVYPRRPDSVDSWARRQHLRRADLVVDLAADQRDELRPTASAYVARHDGRMNQENWLNFMAFQHDASRPMDSKALRHCGAAA